MPDFAISGVWDTRDIPGHWEIVPDSEPREHRQEGRDRQGHGSITMSRVPPTCSGLFPEYRRKVRLAWDIGTGTCGGTLGGTSVRRSGQGSLAKCGSFWSLEKKLEFLEHG